MSPVFQCSIFIVRSSGMGKGERKEPTETESRNRNLQTRKHSLKTTSNKSRVRLMAVFNSFTTMQEITRLYSSDTSRLCLLVFQIGVNSLGQQFVAFQQQIISFPFHRNVPTQDGSLNPAWKGLIIWIVRPSQKCVTLSRNIE
jgi:hypothetical protein